MLEPCLNETAVLYVFLCLKHKSNRCRPLLPHGARCLRGDSDDQSNGSEIVSRHRTRASKVACRGCLEGGRSAIKRFLRYVTRFRFSTQKSNGLFDMHPSSSTGPAAHTAQEQGRVSQPHQFGRSNRVDSRAPLASL